MGARLDGSPGADVGAPQVCGEAGEEVDPVLAGRPGSALDDATVSARRRVSATQSSLSSQSTSCSRPSACSAPRALLPASGAATSAALAHALGENPHTVRLVVEVGEFTICASRRAGCGDAGERRAPGVRCSATSPIRDQTGALSIQAANRPRTRGTDRSPRTPSARRCQRCSRQCALGNARRRP